MKLTKFSKTVALAIPTLVFPFAGPLFAQSSSSDPSSAACDATIERAEITQISPTHSTVYTSVLIAATPDEVWQVLTNFDNMSSWSSNTLQNLSGDLENGGDVVITFFFGTDTDGNPTANEIPHTLIFEDGFKFGWSDPLSADIGGGNDNHLYQVVSCEEQTLFIQSDEIVDNAYAANFIDQLLPLYRLFNAELKGALEN